MSQLLCQIMPHTFCTSANPTLELLCILQANIKHSFKPIQRYGLQNSLPPFHTYDVLYFSLAHAIPPRVLPRSFPLLSTHKDMPTI